MEVQAVDGDVDGTWEVPGGKVDGGAQVEDAGLRAQGEVVEEALGEGAGGIVEVGEEDDGTAFPAFVVAV